MAASLDTQAIAAATAQQFDRYRLLSYPIAAMSQNLAPASVSMMVDGVATPYVALVLDIVSTTAGQNPVPTDSFAVVVAWTGTDVTELLYGALDFDAPGQPVDWADLSDTVANLNLSAVPAPVLNITTSGASSGCHSYSLPELNAAVTSLLQGSACKTGSATVALSFYFIPNPPTNPITSFVLSSQALPMLRLVLPAGTGGQDRLRQMLARGGWRRAN